MKEPFIKFAKTWLAPDVVLITCGLPASGKSVAAKEVQKLKGYPIFSTDAVRREVLKDDDVFDPRIASDISKRQMVYNELFRRGEEAAAKGKGVILDATFVTQLSRRFAAAIAARQHRPFVIMQTVASEEVCLERIAQRTKENSESNALTKDAYFSNKNTFEAIDLRDLKWLNPDLNIMHFIVDTRQDQFEKWCVTAMNIK